MSVELWRPHPVFDGYEFSSKGGFRARGSETMEPVATTLESARRGHHYTLITFKHGGKVRLAFLDRLVCETFNGPAPRVSSQVVRRNPDPGDNRAGNLYWQ